MTTKAEPVRPDDLTISAERRWLAWHHKYAIVCLHCRHNLLPHRDGGWMHWSGPTKETASHEPVALWIDAPFTSPASADVSHLPPYAGTDPD